MPAKTMNLAILWEQLRKLEDNEFNDAEFFANAHWLSCEKIYKKFSIPIISTQERVLPMWMQMSKGNDF